MKSDKQRKNVEKWLYDSLKNEGKASGLDVR